MIQGTHYTPYSLKCSQLSGLSLTWRTRYQVGQVAEVHRACFSLNIWFHTGLGAFHQCSIKKVTRSMNSLLVHGHKICPLAKTTFSFPTEKGGKFFFIALLGHMPLSREALWSEGGVMQHLPCINK